MNNPSLRSKIIDDCMDMKIYLCGWDFGKRIKLKLGDKEIKLPDALFPEFNDDERYEAFCLLKRISSQPMA